MRTRKLVLTRSLLIDLLSEDEFYRYCPIFLFLRESAQQAYATYQHALSRGDCPTCGDREIMQPVLKVFVDSVRQHHAHDRSNLECVKRFIADRKGFYPSPCVIHYNGGRGKTPHRLEL